MDHIVPYPAVVNSGIAWVRLLSCNPLYLDVPGLPPASSGLRSDASSLEMRLARVRRDDLLAAVDRQLDEWLQPEGIRLPGFYSHFYSPHLNFYLYPKELDYVGPDVQMPGECRSLSTIGRDAFL